MASDLQSMRICQSVAPVADLFAADTSSVKGDVVNLRDYSECMFVVFTGVGGTGVSTITVDSCDTVTPTTATAIPFMYKRMTGPAGTDTEGNWTNATSTGFSSTAANGDIYQCYVKADDLNGADKYCRLHAIESTNGAVLGGIMVILGGSRFAENGGRRTVLA